MFTVDFLSVFPIDILKLYIYNKSCGGIKTHKNIKIHYKNP